MNASWISQEYRDALENGSGLQSLIYEAPYRHAVLPNFLDHKYFEAVAASAAQMKTAPSANNIGAARRAQVEWGPISDASILRTFCGQDFRRLLHIAFGRDYRLYPQSIPQIAHFHKRSGGFNCHNDQDEPRDAVALLYLTPDYPLDGGGRLRIHNAEQKVVKQIEPRANTLVLFEVSDRSWHSIEDMTGDWVRRNLLFDWKRVS